MFPLILYYVSSFYLFVSSPSSLSSYLSYYFFPTFLRLLIIFLFPYIRFFPSSLLSLPPSLLFPCYHLIPSFPSYLSLIVYLVSPSFFLTPFLPPSLLSSFLSMQNTFVPFFMSCVEILKKPKPNLT